MSETGKDVQLIQRAIRTAHEIKRVKQGYEPDHMWGQNGNGYKIYEHSFKPVLQDETLPGLIAGNPNPVVVDLMGPSTMLYTLFKDLPSEVHPTGFSLALTDLRKNQKSKDKDTELNITHVTGDIHFRKTWQTLFEEMEKRLGDKKADLVVSRALGGLSQIAVDEDINAIIMDRIWKITADGGVIILQLPHSYSPRTKFENKALQLLADLREQGAETRFDNQGSFPLVYIRKPINSSNNLNFPA